MNSYRERRYKTGLNVRTFAKIIGSNDKSVYNWEQGKTSPRYAETEKNIDYLVDLIEYLIQIYIIENLNGLKIGEYVSLNNKI